MMQDIRSWNHQKCYACKQWNSNANDAHLKTLFVFLNCPGRVDSPYVCLLSVASAEIRCAVTGVIVGQFRIDPLRNTRKNSQTRDWNTNKEEKNQLCTTRRRGISVLCHKCWKRSFAPGMYCKEKVGLMAIVGGGNRLEKNTFTTESRRPRWMYKQ